MKRVLILTICAAGFMLIAAPIYMNQNAHPLFINGHSFGNATLVNGVWAIPLEDLRTNIAGTFIISGNKLQAARDAQSGMASGKRMHKPFTIVKEWGAATPMLTSSGKPYVALSDVAKLFGGTFTAPANVNGGINLTFPHTANAAINWGD